MSSVTIFKGLSDLYIQNAPETANFYPNHFKSEAALMHLSEKLSKRTYPTEALADHLYTYNETLGAGQTTLDNIERLKNGAFTVVSGQQAGIFTGPLYTLYKAISVIKYARQWEMQLKAPVVPIFWIASEDHDFIEIRNAHYITPEGMDEVKIHQSYLEEGEVKTQRVKWLKKSIGDLLVDESYLEGLKTLEAAHEGMSVSFKQLEKIIREGIAQEESLSVCFGKMMTLLLGEYGLILFDPMQAEVRRLEAPFFEKALTHQKAIAETLIKQTEKLEAMGFAPAISVEETNSNLFIAHKGERLSLKCEGGNWSLFGYEADLLSLSELHDMVVETPERFSTNVVLRPVIQDYLFKNLGYVAGPGEMAYYAQLKGVYEVFGQEMPMICPRENFTVVPKAIEDQMKAFHLTFEDFVNLGSSEVQRRVLKACDDIGIDEKMAALKSQVSETYKKTLQELTPLCPHLEPLSQKNLGRILWQLDYIHDKANRFHRKNESSLVSQLQGIERYVLPSGQLQERYYTPFSMQGIELAPLIEKLVCELPLTEAHRWIIL